MRFYEYEARRILDRAGIPMSRHGFAKSAEEARQIVSDIDGPVVIKSQVLTGGRMKAGGVKFTDSPEEAGALAEEILDLEINGHVPRGVLVDTKAAIKREYYAGVTFDGTRKLPIMIFSDMGGIDIEEVAETHPEHVGRGHFSTILPQSDFQAKQVIASVGISGSELNRLTPILARFEIRGAEIDAVDHRGVAGNVTEFDGNLGLVIGAGGGSLTLFDAVRKYGGDPANYCEIGGNPSVHKASELTKLVLTKPGVDKIAVMMSIVSNTRVDIVARGAIKACIELGYEPGEKIAIFRIPGAWEEEGYKILEKYGVEYCDRSVSMHEAARRAVEKIQGAR